MNPKQICTGGQLVEFLFTCDIHRDATFYGVPIQTDLYLQ